jgi:para-nitrobenzyl esterase
MKAFSAPASVAAIAILIATASVANNAPTAVITGGTIRGTIEAGEAVFKAIPFAAPPVKELRWREPRPVVPWTGVREATRFGPACMQQGAHEMSEDCLTLNVWTPEWPSKSPKPVMVWFHGGGNTEGGTNTPYFEGSDLARHGVVIVTAQYRLGAFGFFAHPELTEENPHHASGNYALMDQIAALKWVRDNIAAFGGDPSNVTIFGESAGAEDVGLLLASPLSKGLFERAIAQSGPLRRIYPTLAEQEQSCGELAALLGARKKDQLAFLRALPASQLVTIAYASGATCRPVNIDGYVLTEQPLRTYAEGHQQPVPFMLGNTLREGFTRMPPETLKETIRLQYGPFNARALTAYGLDGAKAPPPDPVYGDASIQYGTDQAHRCRVQLTGLQQTTLGAPFYQFQLSRALPGQTAMSSTHADDLVFVFGAPALAFVGMHGASDVKLAEQMESYWTNFAKSGDPNGPGLPRWTKFDAAKKSYISFTEGGAVAGEGLRQLQCDLFLDAEKARPSWKFPERAFP